MITVYGIPNCDTVKKSLAWLNEHGVDHVFHDFKKQGVPTDRLTAWSRAVGWEKLLNRKGTTWRKLSPEDQAGVTDSPSAETLMLGNPSVIKRPVVDWGGEVTAGFDAADWAGRI